MEDYYLFFDTETTGLFPQKGDRILSIAYILTDAKGTELYRKNEFVKHKDFKINEKSIAFEVNGISNEIMNKKGIEPIEVFNGLMEILRGYKPVLVAHNLEFDMKFLMEELLRLEWQHRQEEILKLKFFCTKDGTTEILKLERASKRSNHRFKPPKLSELHQFCFKKPIENAHDALADTIACMNCFFHLRKKGLLKLY